MKTSRYIIPLILSLILSACGESDDFQGRYTDAEGSSYSFMPEGELLITTQDKETTARYHYDADAHEMRLSAETPLAADKIQVKQDGTLQLGSTVLLRAADVALLNESTWIGNQGQYTFALTFTETENGLETFSELVTYHDDDMSYIYQPDDSITQLVGNKLYLDRTIYTVSDVTDNSLKLSIGGQSMVLTKYPKGTAIEFRNGYTNIDEE